MRSTMITTRKKKSSTPAKNKRTVRKKETHLDPVIKPITNTQRKLISKKTIPINLKEDMPEDFAQGIKQEKMTGNQATIICLAVLALMAFAIISVYPDHREAISLAVIGAGMWIIIAAFTTMESTPIITKMLKSIKKVRNLKNEK